MGLPKPLVKRLATQELPRIRRLGAMFAEEVKLVGGYRPEHHESVWGPLMEAGFADVFYSEDAAGELTGFLGASYVPDLYSGVAAAQSQFWYVDPAHRSGSISVRLFHAFECEAEKRGTQKYFVGFKSGVHEDSMREFFLRHNYVLGEHIYWKHRCQS